MAVNGGLLKGILLLVVFLVALNVATVAAWISRCSNSTIPRSIRDAGIAFGGTATLVTLILTSFRVL